MQHTWDPVHWNLGITPSLSLFPLSAKPLNYWLHCDVFASRSAILSLSATHTSMFGWIRFCVYPSPLASSKGTLLCVCNIFCVCTCIIAISINPVFGVKEKTVFIVPWTLCVNPLFSVTKQKSKFIVFKWNCGKNLWFNICVGKMDKWLWKLLCSYHMTMYLKPQRWWFGKVTNISFNLSANFN